MVSAFTPDNLAVEQYKNLRSQLALRWFNQGNQMLAICSLEAGDGRSLYRRQPGRGLCPNG